MTASIQQAISTILLRDIGTRSIDDSAHLKTGEFSPHTCFVSDVIAASIIGCSASKLRQDRHKRRGIPYSRFGRTVRYSLYEIAKYMASTKVVPEKI